MGKRGMTLLKSRRGDFQHELKDVLVELVIFALVAAMFLTFVDEKVKDRTYEKSYLSKELSLLISAVYAAPENTKFFYFNQKETTSSQGYTISVEDRNKVVVMEAVAAGATPRPVYYPFGRDKGAKEAFVGQRAQAVIAFERNSTGIMMGESLLLGGPPCPDVKTTDASWNNTAVLIDPADSRLSDSPALKEKPFRLVSVADAHDLAKRAEPLGAPDVYSAVLLSTNVRKDSRIVAYISFESDKAVMSKKLACILLKRLNGEFPDFTTEIVPVVPSDNSSSEKYLLLVNKPAILLELPDKVKKDTAKVSSSIRESLREYYG
jgi:hypothetical protein